MSEQPGGTEPPSSGDASAPNGRPSESEPTVANPVGPPAAFPGTAPPPPFPATPPPPPWYEPAYETPPSPSYGTPQPPPPPPPYEAPPSYGTPPPPPSYGTPPVAGYGPPPPPYGYAPAPMPYGSSWMPARSPEASSARTQAIIAMTLNIVSVLFCCAPLGIAGAITAGIGIGRADTDVASAKRLVAWGWGLLIASAVLAVVGFIIFVVFGLATSHSTTSYDGSSY